MTRLRPLTAADVAVLERQYDDVSVAGEFSWFGFRERGRLDELLGTRQTLRNDGGRLVVAADSGELLGEVSWHVACNAAPPNGDCWNFGIWLLPEARGKGHGSEAQRLLAAYLFEHTMYERVEASTEADNLAEQRALEKAGFTREGVLRHACFRAGQWRDMVMYSKLRGEA